MNKTIVVLKIYQGKDIAVSRSTQKILNKHQTISLSHDSKEWYNFTSKMYKNGFGVAEVVSAKTQIRKAGEKTEYKDVSDAKIKEIEAEVQSKLKIDEDQGLTKDQKELKALKAQVAKLLESGSKQDNTPNTNEELEAARDRYFAAFGKKPSHLMKLSTLNEKSEEKENETL